MTPSSPSLSVSTIITNPVSSNYLAFLAFLESWAPEVDEVILVDGGSTDNSLEVAKDWIGPLWSKVRVISTPETYWDAGDNWHAVQAMHNYRIGYEAAETDWVFTVNADNVLDRGTAKQIREQLARNDAAPVVRIHRGKPIGTRLARRQDARAYAVNRKLHGHDRLPLSFGVTVEEKSGCDFPITPTHKTRFLDPGNDAIKSVFAGTLPNMDIVLDIECLVFGHYFFSDDVALQKVCRWERAFARYDGRQPASANELRLKHRLFRSARTLSKEQLLNAELPPEIRRVVEEHYSPEMAGAHADGYPPPAQRFDSALMMAEKSKRHLRGLVAHRRGYRGLKELHEWVPIGEADPAPLDVKSAYEYQERFLSHSDGE